MPASDDLNKLAVRAKEAQDRVTAAQQKAKADLEEDVDSTRTAVEKQNAVMRERVSEEKGRISDHWSELQTAWNEIVGKVREDIEARKTLLRHDRLLGHRRESIRSQTTSIAVNIDFCEYAAVETRAIAIIAVPCPPLLQGPLYQQEAEDNRRSRAAPTPQPDPGATRRRGLRLPSHRTARPLSADRQPPPQSPPNRRPR